MVRAIILGVFSTSVCGMAFSAGGDDFAWLTGQWSTVQGGNEIRETWLEPFAGIMAGTTITARANKPARLEFMSIRKGVAGWEFNAIVDGQPPVRFGLIRHEPGQKAVFENKAHDFPQRVIYWRCDADLCARIEGQLKGKPAAQEWQYRIR